MNLKLLQYSDMLCVWLYNIYYAINTLLYLMVYHLSPNLFNVIEPVWFLLSGNETGPEGWIILQGGDILEFPDLQ